MAIPFLMILIITISSAATLPANNDQLDKATINDVIVNTVSEEKKIQQSQPVLAEEAPVSTIQITGITTGASSPQPAPPVENPPSNPPRPSSMFARFIDDIFQIPITVLQNVARLITNPFQRKSPEIVATVS
ncbi:unnamed protein product [Phyllotreta striolata]|uniref:Uncharacterized protein n=1 Tax=Phyllotreta striolata TaxID=444603 RepID=A0A9N9XQZ0_PHYSR|nr:unnamed protein product [Phyllotreta striolata]